MAGLPAEIRIDTNTPFPALVTGANGVGIGKQNGIWTVALNINSLATAAPTTTQLLSDYVPVWDSVANNYVKVALSVIQQGLSGAIIYNYLGGLTLANDTTSPNTVIDVATGTAASDDNTAMMTLANAMTKSISGTWAVNSGSNGLDAGAVAASTWYHVFLIGNTSTGAVDVLLSTSATAPTMTLPNAAGFAKKRRIGAIFVDASSHIVAFNQVGDRFLWSTPRTDYSNQALGTTAVAYSVPNQPKGITITGIFNVTSNSPATGSNYIVVAAFDGSDAYYLALNASQFNAGQYQIKVMPAQQIIIYSSVAIASGFYLYSIGWTDNRGK
jgi:hypothetical protein